MPAQTELIMVPINIGFLFIYFSFSFCGFFVYIKNEGCYYLCTVMIELEFKAVAVVVVVPEGVEITRKIGKNYNKYFTRV